MNMEVKAVQVFISGYGDDCLGLENENTFQ